MKQTNKQFLTQQQKLRDYLSTKNPKAQKEAQEIVENMSGKWDTLYEQKQDPSRADFSWCLACFQRGYSPEAVAIALGYVSKDIATRKAGHLDDYINRTITKAVEVAQQIFKQEVQEEPKIRTQER